MLKRLLAILGMAGAVLMSRPAAAVTWNFRTLDPASPERSCPDQILCPAWLKFRAANPWPYQTTAIEERPGEAVVVLSEPPPSIRREDLRAAVISLFGADLLEAAYLRWPTGADGWLEDLVLRVKVRSAVHEDVLSQTLVAWSVPRDLVERLQTLALLQYGTADGMWFHRIETRTTPVAIKEIRVSASELRTWLSKADEAWTPLQSSGGPIAWGELSLGARPGAFRRKAGQLVVLVIPKGQVSADLGPAFRRFAVESDLLLGGLKAKNGAMILVGRQRRLHLDAMPPMRLETYAAFASAPDAELAQSYERQRIFAGRVREGRYSDWDWAPILLSPQLQDGEMGTLLNIADQILKSWSQHGEVTYYGFAYPVPKAYPFGDKAASDYFGQKFQTTSLRFNWNTKDFAALVEAPERSYLTVERTGALPILYEPSASLLELVAAQVGERGLDRDDRAMLRDLAQQAQSDAARQADSARNLFAGFGDPVLARVVQNVILFEAVQNLAAHSAGASFPASRSDRTAQRLRVEANAWIGGLSKNDWVGLPPKVRATVTEYLNRSGATQQQLADAIATPQVYEDRLRRRQSALESRAKGLSAMAERANALNSAVEEAFDADCKTVGGTRLATATGVRCQYRATSAQKAAMDKLWAPEKAMEADAKAAADAFKAGRESLAADGGTFGRDVANFTDALAVGALLSKNSSGAARDDILERVLAAGAEIAAPGSIRTPSIVLSKNTKDIEAVGGHSLDLRPGRVRLVADGKVTGFGAGGDIPTVTIPLRRVGEAEDLLRNPSAQGRGAPPAPAPRPLETALGDAPPDSLLGEMRRASAHASPVNLASAVEALKTCNCDLVVRQAADGSVALARRGPPIVTETLFGKSAVIDRLGQPPKVNLVMFEGFSADSVGHIGQSVELLSSGGRGGRKGFFDNLGKVFDPGGPDEPSVVLLAKRGDRLEPLKVWGDPAPLRRVVDWKHASSESAAPDAWSNAFPGATIGARDQAVFLRLGPPGPSGDVVGIRARGAGSPSEPGLLGAVRSWLGGKAAPAPVDESLIALRQAIGAAMPSREVDYFLKSNAKTIRAAETAPPPGTTGAGS